MKNVLLVLALLFSLTGCDDEPSKPTTKPPTKVVQLRKEINKIVEESPGCTEYRWKNRGVAPKVYIQGMAVMYAKQVCGQGTDFIKSDKIKSTYRLSWENKDRPHVDALGHYGISGSELNTYTFLIGLGMRESSGKYCEGRDRSQDFTKASSAEAGLFQMAHLARLFNAEMDPLYKKYKEGKLRCEFESFYSNKIENDCTSYDRKTFGTGEGADWQKLQKKCPALAVQWAAILIRSNLNHFGPIKRKEVEFKKECKVMLEKVEELAKDNCSQL